MLRRHEKDPKENRGRPQKTLKRFAEDPKESQKSHKGDAKELRVRHRCERVSKTLQ